MYLSCDRLCEEEPDKAFTDLLEIALKQEASIIQSNEISIPMNKVNYSNSKYGRSSLSK